MTRLGMILGSIESVEMIRIKSMRNLRTDICRDNGISILPQSVVKIGNPGCYEGLKSSRDFQRPPQRTPSIMGQPLQLPAAHEGDDRQHTRKFDLSGGCHRGNMFLLRSLLETEEYIRRSLRRRHVVLPWGGSQRGGGQNGH
jgi:hypothetical protein